MLDLKLLTIRCKKSGNRTAYFETPLNQTRKEHKIICKFYRLYNWNEHRNKSIWLLND